MTKTEEVARAISATLPYAGKWEEDGIERRAMCLAAARAALSAMRTPTEAMVDAAIAPYRYKNTVEFTAVYRETVKGYMAAMIDAALGEAP